MRLALFSTLMLILGAGGCGGEAEVAEADTSELIGTYYAGSNGVSRTIYAKANAFRGTPRVRITTRTTVTGSCNAYDRGMAPVPPTTVNQSICASLGLSWHMVNGGSYACTATMQSNVAVGLLSYTLSSLSDTQLNYEVIDLGNNAVLNRSGWVPGTPGNGCPRTFNPK